jgi:hypothetical protein
MHKVTFAYYKNPDNPRGVLICTFKERKHTIDSSAREHRFSHLGKVEVIYCIDGSYLIVQWQQLKEGPTVEFSIYNQAKVTKEVHTAEVIYHPACLRRLRDAINI